MLKDIYANKLIYRDEFLREVVDKECEKLNNLNSDKIIINGGRGTGKSVLLNENTNRELGTLNQTILMNFESPEFNQEVFDNNFFEHYYEILFASKLLTYLKNNYPILFEKEFVKENDKINSCLLELDNYINEIFFSDVKINKYYKTNELVNDIIKKIRNELKVSYLNLSIDHFDRKNTNKLVQKLLSKYFNNFNKTFITVDDETIDQKKLENKGYLFMNISYNYNVNVIKEIFNRRLKSIETKFNIELIPNEIFDFLVIKTKGNITLMLDILREWITDYDWDEKNDIDLSAINQEIAHNEAVRKLGGLPKLYL